MARMACLSISEMEAWIGGLVGVLWDDLRAYPAAFEVESVVVFVVGFIDDSEEVIVVEEEEEEEEEVMVSGDDGDGDEGR